jgi:hypothetical protein
MLALFASVVSIFPPAGRLAIVGNQVITSELTLEEDHHLLLMITMRDKVAADEPAVFPNA